VKLNRSQKAPPVYSIKQLKGKNTMKKKGTLNTSLSLMIASMGHTDKMVVCDSGLPIPKNSNVVDLALTKNIPRFIDTVRVILEELQIEKAIIAKELPTKNKAVYRELMSLLDGVEVVRVSHNQFKKLIRGRGNISFVRTGEATPFSNVILVSGVSFG
jgi:D-ribose pyranase